MNKQNLISGAIIVVLIGLIIGGVVALTSGGIPKKYQESLTGLAQCLTDKGAKFYGAYWCPHCIDQKRSFGKAVKDLPYVECAVVGQQNKQTPECELVTPKIDGYPTWIFADGTRMNGFIKPEKLAEKVGCPFVALPTDETSEEVGATSSATGK